MAARGSGLGDSGLGGIGDGPSFRIGRRELRLRAGRFGGSRPGRLRKLYIRTFSLDASLQLPDPGPQVGDQRLLVADGGAVAAQLQAVLDAAAKAEKGGQ